MPGRPRARQAPTGVVTSGIGRLSTSTSLCQTWRDLEQAVATALAAGAIQEGPTAIQRWGKIARLADPFGHGFCLIEFTGRGYDEVATHGSEP